MKFKPGDIIHRRDGSQDTPSLMLLRAVCTPFSGVRWFAYVLWTSESRTSVHPVWGDACQISYGADYLATNYTVIR